jgi:hypothetical protein
MTRWLLFIPVVTGIVAHAAAAQPIPKARLDQLFLDEKAAFHREIAARLERSRYRSMLDSAEMAGLTGGLPDLFDRVIYLAWQRDAPRFERLLRTGDLPRLRKSFHQLTMRTAGRLVDNLFRRADNFELLIRAPGREGRRPLALMLPTLGYGAQNGDPGRPADHRVPADRQPFRDQWWIPAIRLPEAHRVTEGQGTKVAIVDTGIDPYSDLFDGRLAPCVDLVARAGPPWGDRGDRCWDWGGHGTAVASVLLVAAPGVTIIPIRSADGRVSNDPPYPYWLIESLAAGIYAAVHQGARVINVSAGGDGDPILEAAIDYAIERGVVVVSAAGRYARNQRLGEPFHPRFPGSYPQVITAGAFGMTDGRPAAWTQMHPSGQLDVLTPGMEVLMASPSFPEAKPPQVGTGTSLSAPIASGVVALMMAADSVTPAATRASARYPRWIESILRESSNPGLVGQSGLTARTGFGAIDAAGAVARARAGMPRE